MVPAGNKARRLLSVNHTTKTIHHHHHIEVSGPYPEFFFGGGIPLFQMAPNFFSLQLPILAVVKKYYYIVTVLI